VSGSRLDGRVAVVTGAGSRQGIGFAVARRFLDLGADVFLHRLGGGDREECEPDALVADLPAEGRGRVETFQGDLADPAVPERLIETAWGSFEHVDVLVLNHARSVDQGLEELTPTELDLSFQVNARASLLLIKEWAARHDDERRGGRVIYMTSGQHLGPMTGELPYAASKGALLQLLPSLAAHLAPRRITVNAVNPGPTDTGWASPEIRARVLERMPFGRWGRPDDAAKVVSWLASDDAEWVTGQVINSEGGFGRYG
jgi:3-oxoacyl-[acyl-carrier protein] reductase